MEVRHGLEDSLNCAESDTDVKDLTWCMVICIAVD